MELANPGSHSPWDRRRRDGSGRLAVVAFGGNAIIPTGQRGELGQQIANLEPMASQLARMIDAGWSVVVTHGNGPQVGNIKLQQEAASPQVPAMPLDVCGAMSQGQVGYLLAQALSAEFTRHRIARPVVAVVTRCVVAPDDTAFANPTKPIGPFYDEANAARLAEEKGWTIVPDAGRGYRRVVPSPAPRSIVERETIGLLARSGVVVIAAGGGGVPVLTREDGGFQGLEAVVDKDLAACLLARELGADTLVLLTEVPEVSIHFGTPRQQALGDVTPPQLLAFAAEGHFPAGSMGPKIEAVASFVGGGGRLAVITSSDLLMDALAGSAGTRVRPVQGRGLATRAIFSLPAEGPHDGPHPAGASGGGQHRRSATGRKG